MLDLIYLTLAFLIALAVLVTLAAVLARVIGYGARQGWDRAQPRRARLVTYWAPAPAPLGGLCGAGHWVMPGTYRCGHGHAHMPTETARAVDSTLVRAREVHYNWTRWQPTGSVPYVDPDTGEANGAEVRAQGQAAGWGG